MDAAKELEAKVEKQLEVSAERVMEGQVDSTDNKTRYLGAHTVPLLLFVCPS
jgi:hypothetical protein